MLFGHKKGSFTDAIRDKVGYFQEADGGTLFLDEITETTKTFQVKLLRVLEKSAIRQVGGDMEPITKKILMKNLESHDVVILKGP